MEKFPKINNKHLFSQAFTHRSYLNETKKNGLESNERLEFLGDSILSFIISDHLYHNYPDFDEGILTNLRAMVVNTKSLANMSRKLDFGEHLLLSKGEEESGGRQNETLLANTFEAYLGALFIDQGLDAAKSFISLTIIPLIEKYVAKKVFKDPKSQLQENVQALKQSSPIYKVLNEDGPPHAKIFTIGVFVDNQKYGEGIGHSKQEGESKAAMQALEHFTNFKKD